MRILQINWKHHCWGHGSWISDGSIDLRRCSFGKTEIAIRAAFKAVTDNKQVAVLVPTTILSLQHYRSFSERLKEFPCRVDYINRFKTGKKLKATLGDLKAGKVDILVGTHKLVGKQVEFADLGLLIIDEEQKFGVSVKDKLKTMKANVDTLTLTATPIPRTLRSLWWVHVIWVSFYTSSQPLSSSGNQNIQRGAHQRRRELRDLSWRTSIFQFITKLATSRKLPAWSADWFLTRACHWAWADGWRQAWANHERFHWWCLRCPGSYHDHRVWIDISNANTMIINDAHNHGLSDLHQLRTCWRSIKKPFVIISSTAATDQFGRGSACKPWSNLATWEVGWILRCVIWTSVVLETCLESRADLFLTSDSICRRSWTGHAGVAWRRV